MLLILSYFYFISQAYARDRCDIKHCLAMKDAMTENSGIYRIEDPTEEERFFCESQSGPACFTDADNKGCVTKVLVVKKKPSVRYCFHKERKLDAAQSAPVKMICYKGKADGEVSPYECPDLDHYEGWDYRSWMSHNNNEILGPTKWNQKFLKCGGRDQSPVDLVTSSMVVVDKTTVEPISIFGYDQKGFQKEKWRIENNGHSAEVERVEKNHEMDKYMTGGPLQKEGGGKYNLLQYHFHWGNTSQHGSEHAVDGKEFPMEMHIVHKFSKSSKSKKLDPEDLAVLGFLFEVSEEDNAMLLPITDLLKKITNWDDETEFEEEFPNLAGLVKDAINGDFYSYKGSLTTPPCSPIVRWIVFKNTIKISEAQLGKFRTLWNRHNMKLLSNHRPVQPLKERKVHHYQ